MPKKQPKRIKRKSRGRRGVDWSGPETKHGPFGLFSNVRLFYVIGIVIMVGGLALQGTRCRGNSASTAPTPIPVTETATPLPDQITPTPTVEQVKQWPAPPQMGIDTAKTYTATITTSKGPIVASLFAADAPNTVNNFVFLAQQGFFNNLPFFYANADLYAATGDPSLNATTTTKGGPGYDIPNEPNSRTFAVGSLGMFVGAKDGTSAGSRFFIVLNPSQANFSNMWPFGEVKSGMDVVQKLAQGDLIVSVDIQAQ